MTVSHIVGARPQFIKYFPVFRAMERHNEKADEAGRIQDVLIHTGQHYDYAMSKRFFDEFGLKEPDYHLNVGSASHGKQTGEILKKTEAVLRKVRPDVVMVYGDTNSTLGGALAAVKLHLPVAHVEAGLRSYNRRMPEEINRIAADHVSSMLFCPGRAAVENLKKEGFTNVLNEGNLVDGAEAEPGPGRPDDGRPVVVNSGDVMYDVFLHARGLAAGKSRIVEKLGLTGRSFGLLTLHRAENTDDLKQFLKRAGFVKHVFKEHPILFPAHPRIRKQAEAHMQAFGRHVTLIDPVGYFDLLRLLEACDFVLTDSGGLQKEAYWSRKQCVTLREETEWVETLESEWNTLAGEFKGLWKPDQGEDTVYGHGRAAEGIVGFLFKYFNH
ncbi:MAG TPA: UDP-N-acetyl glucosamine 2-epimerase [Ignavibacteria bacterium]|nr:UDP-N-acetyl glucosamine 2-epimerase [Ignavibacteria bacterium]